MCSFSVAVIVLSCILCFTSAYNFFDDEEILRNHPTCRKSLNVTYFADKENCNSYYICMDGDAYHVRCPDNLEYNAREVICDYLSNAGCSVIKNYPECQQGVESFVPDHHNCGAYYVCQSDRTAIRFVCPSGLEYNPKLQICDYEDRAGCSYVFNYPACTPGKTGFIPHPKDCAAYYVCLENGDAGRQNCPDGYHFNLAQQMCDYPENVSC